MAETPLPHLNERGDARMVDVSAKEVSARSATAAGLVRLSPEAVAALRSASLPKGDALAVARIAGIQAAKKTPDLVMLCHPLALSGVDVGLSVVDEGVQIEVTVRTTDRTGVEMEALTAVAVAGLNVIDMVKAVDRAAAISDVRVLAKSGGRRGDWIRKGE
jgi:cyclic pyranopterin monophosphate synthase